MSLFARRNEDAGIDMSPTVKDVTLAALPNSPLNEVRIEAEDDERNGRIGKGSRLCGKLVFEGSVRVYGEVEGEIVAGEAVIVRRGGKVNAKIHAREIVIEGEVTADVHATGKLEIGVTGRLTGTVRTPRLVIHEGAVFDGSCSMTGAPDEQDLVVPDALFEPVELNLAS